MAYMQAQTIFGGTKSNISIFLGFSCIHCICINESIPPTHTHTNTGRIHVRLSAPGFGAHRICACADPDFRVFFSSAYFTEGPYA